MRKTLGQNRGMFVLICAAFLLGAAGSVAMAAETASFDVNRLVVCEKVQDREPVGISDSFPAGTEKVYAFLEATHVSADTTVDFVWFHGGQELARVSVGLGQGGRWRTYTSKNLYGLTGSWRVEVQDASGNVVGRSAFDVK